MRYFISRSIVVLLSVGLLMGVAAAQTKKKKRAKQSKASTSQPASVNPTIVKPATAKTTVPVPTATGAPAFSPQPVIASDGIPRITLAEAREALANGTAIIVDVRNEATYKAGHIKGAILIPYDAVKSQIDKLPRNKLIITYCS